MSLAPPPPEGPFGEALLRLVLEASYGNRARLADATRCGCYACGAIFAPDAIRHWVDMPRYSSHETAHALPVTAVCPACAVDAVVAETAWLPLWPTLLAAAHDRWFAHGTPLRLGPAASHVPPRSARIPRAPTVVIPPEDHALLDGVPRFGAWLCTLPETTDAQRAAIRTVLAEWAKLPALTPGFRGHIECRVVDHLPDPPLHRSWMVRIDEPEDDVIVYGFAHDEVTHDHWHAMAHESWHSWHRGAAETYEDHDPARWLADVAALPEIRAHGEDFTVDASAEYRDAARGDR